VVRYERNREADASRTSIIERSAQYNFSNIESHVRNDQNPQNPRAFRGGQRNAGRFRMKSRQDSCDQGEWINAEALFQWQRSERGGP
jgi:hypothetical protein